VTRLLRLSASATVKERRLRELLAGGGEDSPDLRGAVEDELISGSLGLADVAPADMPAAAAALRRALQAVPADAPFSVAGLGAWHAALIPEAGGIRLKPRVREGAPPTAPPEFIAERLEALEHWLGAPSATELGASQQAALALARLVEISPFDEANGRVSRLAASHLMRRAGARPPLLGPTDDQRLRECLSAAFQLATEPLAALLQEASERCLDVMIRQLAAR